MRLSVWRQVSCIPLAAVVLLAGCTPRPPVTTAFDGTYQGRGSALNDPGGLCTQTTPTGTMTVSNGQVTFGRFSGYVQPDGSVQMVLGSLAGGIYVSGTFGNGRFQGQLRNPQPGCNYRLDFARAP